MQQVVSETFECAERSYTHGMTFSRRFYQAAAICSALSAITTLMLIFLPRVYGPPADFDARIAIVHHPAYIARAWAYLVHPFLCMIAALGVAASLRRTAGGAVAVGFLGFMLWGFTEAGQQALTLTTYDRWRVAYPAADESARALIRTQIGLYLSLWDAMYVLLLCAFLLGNVMYAIATWRAGRLGRVLTAFYIGAAVLTIFPLSAELGGPALPPLLAAWLYPALQPAARLTIGWWNWTQRDSG